MEPVTSTGATTPATSIMDTPGVTQAATAVGQVLMSMMLQLILSAAGEQS